MELKEILSSLEQFAPRSFQESYDNAGLIVGDEKAEIKHVLFCLDSTEAVVDEAINKGAQLIVAHHPIVFSGLKSLTGKNYIERTIIKAIKNDIALYAIHTNLDNVSYGVNKELSDHLGLINTSVLSPKRGLVKKLVFFCPIKDAQNVKEAIFKAGAGHIGAYDKCAFQLEGTGSFRPGDNTNPHLGQKGEVHTEEELRIETVVPNYLEKKVVNALLHAHPYEEVAYDLYDLSMQWNSVGSGMIGDLPQEMKTLDFLNLIKEQLKVPCIRHTDLNKDFVRKVAVCGGSGSFLLDAAKAAEADIFITADFKYHQFFDAEGELIIADVGHYESEQFTAHLLSRFVKDKHQELKCSITEVNTNPVRYF